MLRTSSKHLTTVYRSCTTLIPTQSSLCAKRDIILCSNSSALQTNFLNVAPFSTTTSPASSASTSTSTSDPKVTTAAKCPFSQTRDLSSSEAPNAPSFFPNDASVDNHNDDTRKAPPTLQEIPSWPVVGSFFSIIPGIGNHLQEYFRIPPMESGNVYEFYSTLNERFGNFYTIDLPGIGKVHTLNEPSEMMKVLRQEGSYPRGGVSALAPFIKWGKSRGMVLMDGDDNGFFGQGETWRTTRTFLQSDLLSPQAARGYVPGVIEAAQIASKGAPHYADDLNLYLNYCAFDMFQTIMFGELTKIADPNTPTDPINEEFVENSVQSLALMVYQIFDKTEVIKGRLGITTPTYEKFEAAMDKVNKIANDKTLAFKEKWERGDLNEAEKASYVAHAFERQKSDNSVSPDTMTELVMFALNAGVDTTSTFICWAMVHLSLNPDVQDKLYQELKQNLDENGGTLSADILTKTKSPYLHAVLRESHRLTPVHPTVMMKSNSTKDINIHGIDFPQGSLFSFDSYSLGINPDIVDRPEEFDPNRWSKEATMARKGTPAEVLDHQFYKDPFSQGARRCPGSRVAVNETLVLLSQLVLDWKMEPHPTANISTFKDVKYEQKTLLVPILPKMEFTART